MTREELIKALRCFASEDYCPFDECNEKCPYWMETDKYDIDNPNAEISDVHQLCYAAADLLEQDVPPTDMVPKDFHDRCMEMEIGRRMLLEQNAPKWISVKDRLPEHGKQVFLIAYGWSHTTIYLGRLEHMSSETSCLTGITSKESKWCIRGWPYLKEPVVTHWMPLPEPPKEEK